MVCFGKHLDALDRVGWSSYHLDYGYLKQISEGKIKNSDGAGEPTSKLDVDSTQLFTEAWRCELAKVEQFYAKQLDDISRALFKEIALTGQPVTTHLWDFLDGNRELFKSNEKELRTITTSLRLLIAFEEINTDGFRKAAKKFDKLNKTDVSVVLMPELFLSRFGYDERSRKLLKVLNRSLPEAKEPSAAHAVRGSLETRMRDELDWLRSVVEDVPTEVLPALVAHRGFHHTGDALTRPIENSLPAYEQCWAKGINLCECDVNLTTDGYLVLNHDESLQRLALKPAEELRPVSELNIREVVSKPLKNGVRPPLLREVLDMAHMLGPHAQLVIELKPTSSLVGKAVAEFLAAHQHLLPHVAVVMSFDLYIMHEFAAALDRALGGDSDSESPKSDCGYRPKLMLLTVDTQNESFENVLKLQHTTESEIRSWLERDDTKLDGVYIEWTASMLDSEKEHLKALSSKIDVGVWQYVGQPDNVDQAKQLVDCGVRFVNTDMPPDFLGKRGRRIERNLSGVFEPSFSYSHNSLSSLAFQGGNGDLPSVKQCGLAALDSLVEDVHFTCH
eukprot:TRINITY_DN2439_c0_g1_i1.p1 TRINITY_DN2439_c0_g1~~TRINITY_DN2439_c0_g1_i1.p1  ORF type:complete len:561 (-),score=121.14 TRINITY_DN2439_c0_g1_i1:382-2064(-)